MLASSFAELLCASATEDVYLMVSMTFDIGSFIVVFPIVMGYICLCTKISDEKKSELSDLFAYYTSSDKLTECYTFLLRKIPEVFVKIILPFSAVSVLFDKGLIVAEKYYTNFYNVTSDYIPILHFLLQAAVLCLVYFLSGKIIVSVIEFCAGTKRKLTASDARMFFRHRFSLLPLYIISVLSFGVLFLAYTIPFTIIVHRLFLNKHGIVKNDSAVRTDTKEIPFVPGNLN